MRFGELVKQHRERSGMNKQKFAEGLGIDYHYLRQLETGEANSPSAIILARMVRMLHLNPFQANALLRAIGDADKREDGHS